MPNLVLLGNFASVLLCLSLLFSNSTIKCADGQDGIIILNPNDQIMLQEIYGAWKGSTPDLESNLSGWTTYNATENYKNAHNYSTSPSDWLDPCYADPWRGVFCSTYKEQVDKTYDAWVSSLAVIDASITGPFPPDIWNFQRLIALTLTGNPNLYGRLLGNLSDEFTPQVTKWSLRRIVIHDNSLDGTIPLWFKELIGLEELDLSNNQFSGSLPLHVFEYMISMRILKLSNNKLLGSLPTIIFQNWTKLVIMDLSNNSFNGLFPNLNNSRVLHTLNLSHNGFEGEINESTILHSNAANHLAALDLSNNRFSGRMPNPSGWSALKSLELSNNSFTPGPLPTWLPRLHNLQFIGLSNTSLIGEVNGLSMLKSLTKLETLYLDNNNISGILDIASLLNQSIYGIGMSRRTFSMKNNKISGVIYTSNVSTLSSFSINLQGNPYCNSTTRDVDLQRCVCRQVCYDTAGIIAKSNKKTIIIAAVVSGSVIAMIISISVALFWRSKRKNKYLLLAVHKKFAEYEMKPTLYAFSELQKATRDFHVDMKLGEGGFGAVYKGHLLDGSDVAVKQLSTSAQQNMDEFLNEVVLLTGVKHRNLVKLKGCCIRGDRRLLVYEYVENYDLADTLFDHKGNQLLSWPQRFNICLGVAQGLHYLHALVEPRIIHRDIKPSNVLLDKNLQPKIADFGLALLFPNETTHITMVQVAGTKGYLAPEYATLGQLSEKVDVFSFGVLVLEIVSGRRNIDLKFPMDKAYLLEWAWKLNEGGNLMELVDSTILLQTNEELEVQQVMKVAMACLQTVAERRPTMAQVVAIFQGNIDFESILDRSIKRVNRSTILSYANTSEIKFETLHEESPILPIGSSSSSILTSEATYSLELSAEKPR